MIDRWTPEREAADRHLDRLESELMAVAQRTLNDEQRDRLARLLQGAERDVIAGFAAEARMRVRLVGAGLHSLQCDNDPCICRPIAVRP